MNEQSTLQALASWAATAFLVIGILGFVPGVTDEFASLKFAGHRSGAELFGVFAVSTLLNLLHIVLGIAGLWLARTRAGARAYLLGGGAFCLALWVFGLAVSRGDSANFIPVDTADDWLHFVLGLSMVVGGVLLGRRHPAPNTAATT